MRAIVVTTLVVACGCACRSAQPPPPPDCAHLPPRDCDDGDACHALVKFEPVRGLGYFDDAISDEVSAETSSSYARRDLVMLVKYATAKVACTTDARPLGLGDMSDRDGLVPGTRRGAPRHPLGSHLLGQDIDLAYYQQGVPDNRLRAVCAHDLAGIDVHHCVAPPTTLDLRRTALLLGALLESRHVRVIGVDGLIGDLLVAEIHRQCAVGTLSPYACHHLRLAYEPIDAGRGWFYSHHNHLHVSWRSPWRDRD